MAWNMHYPTQNLIYTFLQQTIMVMGLLKVLSMGNSAWVISFQWTMGLATCVALRLLPASFCGGLCELAGGYIYLVMAVWRMLLAVLSQNTEICCI